MILDRREASVENTWKPFQSDAGSHDASPAIWHDRLSTSFHSGPGHVISIRPFRNIDVPLVGQLWNQHRAETGTRTPVSKLSLEVTVLNRPFFEFENLLIASEERTPLGFVHWLLGAEDAREAVVANLSVPSSPRQDEVATALLQAASDAARQQGAARIAIGQAPGHWTGYAGVAVHGAGGGVPEWDVAVTRWATEAGFTPTRQLLNYDLQTATFRASYDRELIGLRRAVTVEHRMEVTDLPFRFAAALSHLQLHRFVARQRSGEIIAEADFMLGDPEMLVVTSGVALLTRWAPVPAVQARAPAATRFVLASGISELLAERITHVQATVEAADSVSTELLQQAGFVLDHRGQVFVKSL